MDAPIAIRLNTIGLQTETVGLVQIGQAELRARVDDPELLPHCQDYLLFLADYVQEGARIRDGETVRHGYWHVMFKAAEDVVLEAWEYNAEATEYVPGATLTLTYWVEQYEMCQDMKAERTHPRPDQLVITSEGVMEGEPVWGERYPSPDDMSGWWLTTDKYDGDTKQLSIQHLFHVTAARPDLVCYLALPYGYRFSQQGDDAEYVWFDEEVANPPGEDEEGE